METTSSYSPLQSGKFEGFLHESSIFELGALAPQWRRLTPGDAFDEPFFQPEWFASFARAFSAESRMWLVTVRSDSTLRGVLPLMKSESFFCGIAAPAFRSLSGKHSCRFDLVHATGERENVARAAWESLRDNGDWEVIEALDVPAGGAFEQVMLDAENEGYLTGRWPTRLNPCLSILSRQDPFGGCTPRYAGYRKRLRSYQEKLEKDGPVSLEVFTRAENEVLRRFFALESSGWKGRRGSAIFGDPALVNFYTRVAVEAADQDSLRIYSLSQRNHLIAMEFGLLRHGRYYSPKAAYNEDFRKYSPGHLLVSMIIKDLAANGVTLYDFLGPMAQYKRVWAPEVREHSNLYIFRPSVKGRMLHALTMKAASFARRVKHRMQGNPQNVD